jgi:selenocysteine-specific elongation factor
MTRHVVATAGHVDHGKSTLIRVLTGMEPDRWAEERRRGLTIDLGFAWTTLPSGREVDFVDVPGHERFLANALAGVGPVRTVCFVVAADEGWSVRSSDHRDAIAALGISGGLVVVTKVDRAPALVDETVAQVREELRDTGLRHAPVVAVSALKGRGIEDLRETLDEVLAAQPPAEAGRRVRLWVDRSFTISGSGTVVTGTLAAGSLAKGQRVELLRQDGPQTVTIRGLQSRGIAADRVGPVARVAVNLRGVSAGDVRRGDLLVTPDAWPSVGVVDVRRTSGPNLDETSRRVVVHLGTAAVSAQLRAFGGQHARLVLERPLPLVVGDRLLLRAPGRSETLGGVQVLDPDPPPLVRRGDGQRRRSELEATPPDGDVLATLARQGLIEATTLRRFGLIESTSRPPDGVRDIDGVWVHVSSYRSWVDRARVFIERERHFNLSGKVAKAALSAMMGPQLAPILDRLIADAGLVQQSGNVYFPELARNLGSAEAGVAELEDRLTAAPFDAPQAGDLATLGLGVRELAAAEEVGRILSIGGGVVLLPQAPAVAVAELSRLPQPFTTSQARRALNTSRRVVVPLLELLDAYGWTTRLDDKLRQVQRTEGHLHPRTHA